MDNSYNPRDGTTAFQKALEWGEKIPIGIIYTEERSTYEENNPKISEKPLKERFHDIKTFERILDYFKV